MIVHVLSREGGALHWSEIGRSYVPRDYAPEQIEPRSLDDYLEVMTKPVFQSGMSWKVVDSKWHGIREVLLGFNVEAVANLTPPEVDEIALDKRVIRNRRKLDAIVHNAQRMIELDEKHGGFKNYLRSHATFGETVKDLRKQFKFLGDMGCYYFLYVVGEDVPLYAEWMQPSQRRAAGRL